MSMQLARELVMRHGWNSTVYQILNPGFEHWWPVGGQGVVGFVRPKNALGGAWVAAGAPVCERRLLTGMVREFEDAAAEESRRVCYFCAGSRMLEVVEDGSRHAVVGIGAQPVWDPREWPEIVQTKSGVRAQLNRARNKGVRVSRWSPKIAREDVDVRRCLKSWIDSRPMPALRFMVDPHVLEGVLEDRVVLVAQRQSEGAEHEPEVVGFLVASPVPQRNGYLVEQIVRAPWAPNGTAELLIDAAMRELADRGSTYVTLGLVALAERARELIAENPLWLRVLMGWARAHGRRFYHFDGLEAFRAKLQPMMWEPVYAIANEPRFSMRTLYAVAQAFCVGSPLNTLGVALGRAIRQEGAWARDLMKRR